MFHAVLHLPSSILALLLLLPAAASYSFGIVYVDDASANPPPPYTTWATVARVPQDAVDTAVLGANPSFYETIRATRWTVAKPLQPAAEAATACGTERP